MTVRVSAVGVCQNSEKTDGETTTTSEAESSTRLTASTEGDDGIVVDCTGTDWMSTRDDKPEKTDLSQELESDGREFVANLH